MTHNDTVIHNGGGNYMATMRERFSEFVKRHIVDEDPCEPIPELSGESITDEDRKEASRVLIKHENLQAILSATKGEMSVFHHGHPEALKGLEKTFREMGFTVTVR